MSETTPCPTYQIVETVKETPYGAHYCCYGLRMQCEDGHTVCIEDLSSGREQVEQLVHLCNTLQLSALHFWDVAQDFVSVH